MPHPDAFIKLPEHPVSPDANHPWIGFGLHCNPFGELSREDRIAAAVVDVNRIANHVCEPRTAYQLVGECGRGKTTRMLVLSRQILDSVYVYIAEDEPCPAIPHGSPCLIDEAQRLPRVARKAVFASGLPLVLATHRDLTRSLKRHGYSVVTEAIGLGNDARHLCRVLNRRIEVCRIGDSQIDGAAVPQVTLRDAKWLFDRFGTDFRSAEHFLYEKVQTQAFCHGEMRFID